MPHFLLLFPLSKFPISTLVQIYFLFSSLIVIVLLYEFVYRNLYVINYKPLILYNSTCMYTFLVWPLGTRQPINFSLPWEGPTLPLLNLLYCLKFFVSGWGFKRFPPSCWACYWWYSFFSLCLGSVGKTSWVWLLTLPGDSVSQQSPWSSGSYKCSAPFHFCEYLSFIYSWLWTKTFLLLYFQPFSLWQATACEVWQNSDSSWKGQLMPNCTSVILEGFQRW